jgi:hypothetical protein
MARHGLKTNTHKVNAIYRPEKKEMVVKASGIISLHTTGGLNYLSSFI